MGFSFVVEMEKENSSQIEATKVSGSEIPHRDSETIGKKTVYENLIFINLKVQSNWDGDQVCFSVRDDNILKSMNGII